MKNKVALLLTGCLVWLMSSCLGSDKYDVTISNNCQIKSFTLKDDSVPGLAKVHFTIDQLSDRIFNIDSMPYGTKVKKVVCTVSFGEGTSYVRVVQEAVGDTINWNTTDSLDFSKPVQFITHSFTGQYQKTYKAQLNIHQVVPDSMVWSVHAGKVTGLPVEEQKVLALTFSNTDYYYMYAKVRSENGYRLYTTQATDAKSWTEQPLTGLPDKEITVSQITEYEGALYAPGTKGIIYKSENGQAWAPVSNTPVVKYMLGAIRYGGVNQQTALATIVHDADNLFRFASMDETGTWSMGGFVPAEFPVTGFGAENHSIMYKERLTIACGHDRQGRFLNSVWATMDGVSWAVLTDETKNKLPEVEGAMLSYYDEKFFLIGGINRFGLGQNSIYNSKDNGVTWSYTDSLVVLPNEFTNYGFGTVLVDKENYMYIFGGKKEDDFLMGDQVWRGRINRLGFKKN